MSIGGINANYSLTTKTPTANSGQNARPTFAHNHTWSSIGDMTNAWKKYTQEWSAYYSTAFAGSGANGDGKITQEELSDLLQSEFGGMGVKFTDSAVDEQNPSAGKFEVFIDETTRQKMANDPEYRAKVMGVIQSEMGGTGGYSVQGAGGVINDRTTGLSMNMIEGGPIYEGVPHSAGGTSTGGGIVSYTKSESGAKGKSMMELIMERLEKKREEKKEAERKEEAKKTREDLLEISVEAKAKIATLNETQATETEGATIEPDESDTLGNGLNVLA